MKFLKFTLNLPECKQSVLTEELTKEINLDYEHCDGIYIACHNLQIHALEEDDTIVLCGTIYADTIKDCKAFLTATKANAKKRFNTKKVTELMVGWGDKLF